MERQNKIKSRFTTLDSKRLQHLERCRLCSKLTLPYVLPPNGIDSNQILYEPYQSKGAEAVNTLASKIWMTMLPPNSGFFKLALSTQVEQELATRTDVNKSDLELSLSKLEKIILDEINNRRLRAPAFSAFRHLVITGNVLVYIPKPGQNYHALTDKGFGLKFFRLDNYVVSRDSLGNVMEIVIRETTAFNVLPPELQELVKQSKEFTPGNNEKNIEVYTRISRKEGNGRIFVVQQEIAGIPIPESEGEIKEDELPWFVIRWSHDGDYGRGPVENYLGDFLSLEGLEKAIVEGSLAAAKVIFLNDPNGTTSSKKIAKAKNGDIIPGRKGDISTIQLEKFADFRVALEEKGNLEKRIERAFLMTSAIQRQAERVTAEEIRVMAGELENTLGGVYSLLSEEFQYNLVKLIMEQLKASKILPNLPDKTLNLIITTGLEALGRSQEQNKIRTLAMELSEVFGPQVTATYLSPSEYAKRTGTNLGIDTKGLVYTDAQVQQSQQAANTSEALKNATPVVAGKIAEGAIKNGKQE